MGQETRQVVGFGDRSTGRGNFGILGTNLGRPVLTNGDLTLRDDTALCRFKLLWADLLCFIGEYLTINMT